MIAITKQPCQTVTARENEQFLEMLPLIRALASRAFHDLRPEGQEEMIEEVIANAYCAFARLVRRGKTDVAYATPLANFAVRQARSGRRVGAKLNSLDASSVVAQRQRGFFLESLQSSFCQSNSWIEILADNRVTPVPDQVIFRLDFAAWLRTQGRRDRELARFLALGNTPAEAAERFRVSRARISQLRAELQSSWEEFQGETT